jgi:hypothetical protein
MHLPKDICNIIDSYLTDKWQNYDIMDDFDYHYKIAIEEYAIDNSYKQICKSCLGALIKNRKISTKSNSVRNAIVLIYKDLGIIVHTTFTSTSKFIYREYDRGKYSGCGRNPDKLFDRYDDCYDYDYHYPTKYTLTFGDYAKELYRVFSCA